MMFKHGLILFLFIPTGFKLEVHSQFFSLNMNVKSQKIQVPSPEIIDYQEDDWSKPSLSPYGPPTRCTGSQVLFHRPTDCDQKDLPLLLWVHGGGMILGSFLAQRLAVGICQDEGWPASPSIQSLGKMWVRHVWELSNWAKFQRSSNILKMERNKKYHVRQFPAGNPRPYFLRSMVVFRRAYPPHLRWKCLEGNRTINHG